MYWGDKISAHLSKQYAIREKEKQGSRKESQEKYPIKSAKNCCLSLINASSLNGAF